MLALALALVLGGLAAPAADASAPGEIPRPPGDNPGNRGWEKVTPADKGGLDAPGVTYDTWNKVAENGQGLLFGSMGVFAGSEAGGFPSYYRAQRGAEGWGVAGVSPPGNAVFYGAPGWGAGANAGRSPSVLAADGELDRLVVESNAPVVAGLQPDSLNLYRRDLSDGGYSLITPGSPDGVTAFLGNFANRAETAPSFHAASPDMRHVVFGSSWPFTADEPAPNPFAPRSFRLYVSDGESVELISKQPGTGEPMEGTLQAGSAPTSTENAVSEDGRTVYFTATDGSREGIGSLYRWHDGEVELVQGGGEARFYAASADGSKALFEMRARIYLYDATAGTVTDIFPDIAAPSLDALPIVTATSEDLRRVYFASIQAILPGEQWPSSSSEERGAALYVAEDQQVRRIAVFHFNPQRENVGIPRPADGNYPGTGEWNNKEYVALTPDGETLAFDTTASVTNYDARGTRQVYRYDYSSDSLECLSCPDGPPTGDARMGRKLQGRFGVHARPIGEPYRVSEDGRRVVFSTPDPLVGEDDNGARDVYVWEDGAAHLVSDGKSRRDADVVAATRDLDDVFFATAARLTAADSDDLVDIYDARIGGGFPEPAQGGEECVGDPCQGRDNSVPESRRPGSGGSGGAGDLPAVGAGRVSLGRLSARQARALARGAAVGLRVRVSQPGRVRAVLRVQVGGRGIVAGRSAANVQKKGQAAVRVRLNRPARRALARGQRLRLRVEVRLGGASAGRTVEIAPVEGGRRGR